MTQPQSLADRRRASPQGQVLERAFFVSQLDLLEGWTAKFTRLYFGNEFCQHLIPTPGQVEKALEFARSKRGDFTLVTPYVTDAGLDKLRILFDLLAREAPDTEIVVNDWGVLRVLHREYQFSALAFGRLLTKQKRDPRLGSLMHAFPRGVLANFRNCHLSVPEVRRFLVELGIKRLEFDNLLQGLSLALEADPPLMTNSLYYPFGYITTTRLCKASDLEEGSERLVLRVIERCSQTCRDFRTVFQHQSLRDPIVAQGNTFFYQNQKLPPNLEELGINRLVFQPEIPMPLNPSPAPPQSPR